MLCFHDGHTGVSIFSLHKSQYLELGSVASTARRHESSILGKYSVPKLLSNEQEFRAKLREPFSVFISCVVFEQRASWKSSSNCSRKNRQGTGEVGGIRDNPQLVETFYCVRSIVHSTK